MPGGLIQIATAGTNDIVLTGNPQITFFLIIYRRYTNFGKKNVELGFNNDVNFSSTSIITIPKNSGDLLSKLTLKIKLPKLDLTDLINQYNNKFSLNGQVLSNQNITPNSNNITNIISNDISYNNVNSTYIVYYNYFNSFYNNLKNVIINFFLFNDNLNTITYINDLSKYILKYINNDQYQQFFNSVNYFFNSGLETIQSSVNTYIFLNASLFKNINNILTYIYNLWNNTDISYDGFKYAVNKNMEILNELNGIMYDILKNKLLGINNFEICWVNKIAINIINSIEFYIGSNKISTLSDYYINNNGDLFYKNQEIYAKMVGINLDINSFQTVQEEYNLYLPIPFWFNDNYGLAFPLIALQFNTIQIRLNLKSFIECIKININSSINETETKNFVINYIINNISNIFKSQLEVTLIAEYIFLDSLERKKFAQSAHEYLITQVQELDFDNLSMNNNSFELDFYHCCKDLYWFATSPFDINSIFNNEKNSLLYCTKNPNYNIDYQDYTILYEYIDILYNPIKLFDAFIFIKALQIIKLNYKDNVYVTIEESYFNNLNEYNVYNQIIIESYLYFNSVVLIGEVFPYYNYLQSYSNYNNTPQNGLNIYSFSLSPMDSQPSGTCNFSRIPYFSIKLKLNNNTINTTKNNILFNFTNKQPNIQYKLVVQAVNYNVLRFIGGIAATAYTY